jgi:hypothetical protein
MSTDLNALRVETQELAIYARERQEDAIVCHAIRLFTDQVGAVPPQAFGTIERHSERYRTAWARLVAARGTEEVTARDELWNISSGLFQVAADYENTDIEVAYTFDVKESGIAPYLNSMQPPQQSFGYKPGGPVAGNSLFPPWAPFGAVAGDLPGQSDFNATRSEPLPSVRPGKSDYEYRHGKWYQWPGGGHTVEVPSIEAQPGLENDNLFKFVSEHGAFLQMLERQVDEMGLPARKPLADVIIHAYRASPTIIRNRSLLLGHAANGLNEIRSNMVAATENLKYYWNSPGSTGIVAASGVFFTYAETTQAYLDIVADSVEWWSGQGKVLASVLEGIRTAYADAGYKRINDLHELLKKYNDMVKSVVSSCREPEKMFVDGITAFANFVHDSAKDQYTALQDLLKVDDQRRREEALLNIESRVYGEPTPFPLGNAHSGAWSTGSGWTPKKDRPSTVSGST